MRVRVYTRRSRILTCHLDIELLQTSASSLLLSSDAKDLDQATAELLANYKELSERHNAVMERNQALQHECNDLQDIVKSYEENIKVITDKLRSHTVRREREHGNHRLIIILGIGC